MSTMQKLKAYFGMIPADEVDGYQEDYPEQDYGDLRARPRYHHEYGEDFDEFAESARRPERRQERFSDDYEAAPRRWTPPQRPQPASPVRGALAVEPQPEPVPRIRPVQQPVPEENPLSKITTLHLRSYNEALKIGEPYRDGTPVIMNLTEMEDADAKRLVDFAVGMAFAMRGDIDKITNKVFLLSPPNIDVTAEDKKRIAEGGYFARR